MKRSNPKRGGGEDCRGKFPDDTLYLAAEWDIAAIAQEEDAPHDDTSYVPVGSFGGSLPVVGVSVRMVREETGEIVVKVSEVADPSAGSSPPQAPEEGEVHVRSAATRLCAPSEPAADALEACAIRLERVPGVGYRLCTVGDDTNELIVKDSSRDAKNDINIESLEKGLPTS